MKALKNLHLALVVIPSMLLIGIAFFAEGTSAQKPTILSLSWLNGTTTASIPGGQAHTATAGLFGNKTGTVVPGGTLGAAISGSAQNATGNNTSSPKVSQPVTKPAAATSQATTTKQSQPATPSTPAASASLVFSASSVTLPQISATSDGSAFLTISASTGTITQPIASGYQKTAPLETTGTPPSSEIFRSKWTFRLVRNTDGVYGADGMTFTALTNTGKTVSGRVSINILPVPTFTIAKGPLTKVANGDGTVTYTAHLILNPGPYFGNPQLHMCQLNASGYCAVSNDFTYSGNNDLTMSQTITPFPSGSMHAYFDMSVLIDGWYTKGGGTFSWHEDY